MKKSWQIKKLGDVCEVIAGQSPKGKYYNSVGEGMPFFQGKKEFSDKFLQAQTTWTTQITKLAEPMDILMSVRAPVGSINFTKERICIGRGLAAIRAHAIDREYLFHYLRNIEDTIIGKAGAVFPSITKTEVVAISVSPLPEQRRIVTLLDSSFEKIAAMRRNAEQIMAGCDEMKKSILSQAFGSEM